MKRIILAFVCLVFTTSFLSAQQNYNWDEYGITFSLADDFKETANDIDGFAADGDGMSFSIIPFKDETIDHTDINKYVLEIAASLKLEKIEDVSLIDINQFKGGYVEGYKEGVKIFLMGLIDPNTATNFFVIISFAKDDDVATEEAIRMVKSINKQ